MEKLFTLLAIRALTKNTDEAIKIYNTLYNNQSINTPKKPATIGGTTNTPIVEKSKTPDKKTELVESLSYLKGKKTKTIQDKNSIGLIEAILNNMK